MIGTEPAATLGEAITAWRVWRIVPWTNLAGTEEPRLLPLTAWASWPPRQALEARCVRPIRGCTHDAPQAGHDCGVWALRSREWALELAGAHEFTGDWAIGRVSLWGRVIEHRDGYRAQYAYPYDLVVHARDEATARRLRDLYAVDVEWEEMLEVPAAYEAENEKPVEKPVLLQRYKMPHVRFTNRGFDRLVAIGIPAMVTVKGHGYQAPPQAVSTERAIDALTDPPPPFVWEIERDKPAWVAERKDAQAKGREFYVRWLRQWRKGSHDVNRLFFYEDEILDALAEAVRLNGGKAVPFEGLIEQLAPGVPSRFEASWFSSRLVKMRRDGLVKTTGDRIKLWQPATKPQFAVIAGGCQSEPDEREAA